MSNFIVRKVAVLGAGVMGAQIAAHLVNAGVPAVLFDLPAKAGPKSGIALKAIEGSARFGWPSPCAVAIGMRLPAMPARKIEGDAGISTMAPNDILRA